MPSQIKVKGLQFRLPVGFAADGKQMVTLADVVGVATAAGRREKPKRSRGLALKRRVRVAEQRSRNHSKPEQIQHVAFDQLPFERRAALTEARIKAQPTFAVEMVGAGRLSKARAIREVRAQTDVGKLLVEIEGRVVRNVLEKARRR
jgi:hypothetical protein